jgi:hypothetical protein
VPPPYTGTASAVYADLAPSTLPADTADVLAIAVALWTITNETTLAETPPGAGVSNPIDDGPGVANMDLASVTSVNVKEWETRCESAARNSRFR